MSAQLQVPQAVLDSQQGASIESHAVNLSEPVALEIDGQVLRVDDGWFLGMNSVVAVSAGGDDANAQLFAILDLSIVNRDALTRNIEQELAGFSNRGVKSCALSISSDLPNADLFETGGNKPVSLCVHIEFEDAAYTSSPFPAFLVNNKSNTRRLRRKSGGEIPAATFSLLPICFPWYSITFPAAGGVSVTTVCSRGCIGPATCGCFFGGAGVCLGWHPCVCGIRIFGVFLPIRIFLIIFFILLGVASAALLPLVL